MHKPHESRQASRCIPFAVVRRIKTIARLVPDRPAVKGNVADDRFAKANRKEKMIRALPGGSPPGNPALNIGAVGVVGTIEPGIGGSIHAFPDSLDVRLITLLDGPHD